MQTLRSINVHMLVKTHSPGPNLTRNLTKSLTFISTTLHTIVEKTFTCSKCDKNFPKNADLEEHKCAHARKNVFTWSQFDKKFDKILEIHQHNFAYMVENTFTCSKCDKNFPYRPWRIKISPSRFTHSPAPNVRRNLTKRLINQKVTLTGVFKSYSFGK